MQEETADFRTAILQLVEGNVRFVLIGGLAMIARGASHITFDVDVSYDRSAENLIALVDVLKNCHAHLRNAPADLPFILDTRTFKNVQNLTLTTDVGDLDLLAEQEILFVVCNIPNGIHITPILFWRTNRPCRSASTVGPSNHTIASPPALRW